MKARFKLPMSMEQVYDHLLAAIMAEVAYRHRCFCTNEYLEKQLNIPKPYNDGTYGIQIVDAKYIAYLCKNNYESYRKLISVDMLGIDDLGTEPSEVMDYGNVYTPVIDLLTKRYEEQLFTIITTNLIPQQIREHYGDRIADRLNEMVKKIVFNNATYRTDSFAAPG